jgi:hypothetical protein
VGGHVVDLKLDIDFIERCDRYVRMDFAPATAKHAPSANFTTEIAATAKRFRRLAGSQRDET